MKKLVVGMVLVSVSAFSSETYLMKTNSEKVLDNLRVSGHEVTRLGGSGWIRVKLAGDFGTMSAVDFT